MQMLRQTRAQLNIILEDLCLINQSDSILLGNELHACSVMIYYPNTTGACSPEHNGSLPVKENPTHLLGLWLVASETFPDKSLPQMLHARCM